MFVRSFNPIPSPRFTTMSAMEIDSIGPADRHKQPPQKSVARYLEQHAKRSAQVRAKLSGFRGIPAQPVASGSSGGRGMSRVNSASAPPTAAELRSMEAIRLGAYDGGLELENVSRGEIVYGEAAEELALDSSISRSVASPSHLCFILIPPLGRTPESGGYLRSIWGVHWARENSVEYIWSELERTHRSSWPSRPCTNQKSWHPVSRSRHDVRSRSSPISGKVYSFH